MPVVRPRPTGGQVLKEAEDLGGLSRGQTGQQEQGTFC